MENSYKGCLYNAMSSLEKISLTNSPFVQQHIQDMYNAMFKIRHHVREAMLFSKVYEHNDSM